MNTRKTDGTQPRPASWVGFLALVGSLLLGAPGARAAVQYTEVYPPVTLEVTTGVRNEYSVVFRTADGDRTFVLSTERVVDLTVSPNTYRSDLDAAAATPGDGWVRFVDATSTDAELLLPADPVFTGSDPAGWDADRAGGSLAWVTGITSGDLYSGRARGGAFRGQDAYVGVGLPVSGGTAYGWIRVSADSLERSLTVYGYAFEDTAGVDLSAGEGATNYPPLFTNAADVSVYDTFSSVGDSVGFVSATDGESVSDGVPITYSIVGGTGAGLFAIDPATGGITLTSAGAAALDSQTTPSYTLTVQADDGQPANNTATVTLTVTVSPGIIYTPVDPPVTLNTTVAGQMYDVVFNTPGRGPLTYTIRALAEDTPPDFWRQVGIYSSHGNVRVVGATEDSSRLAFGAWVADMGAAPWSVFSPASEAGNLAWGSGAEGTILDSGGNFLGWRGYIGVAISAGADGSPSFGWIEVSAADDASSVTIYGYAFAAPLLTDIRAGAAGPTTANLPPVFTSDAAFSVSELATDDDTTLHDVQSNNGDGGADDADIAYSITGGTGGALFAIDPASGVVTLSAAGAAALDFETTPSYTLQVQADDGQASNNTATQTLTVTVTDAPTTITALQSFAVAETVADGTVVGTVATTGDTPASFGIVAGNTGGAFAIDAAGQLTVADATALDFETTAGYALTVQVGDGTTVTSETVTVAVTDVAPVVTPGQDLSVSETAANGTVVGTVATIGDAATLFTITAGNTGRTFAIDAVGQITVADATALDFETTAGYALTVQVGDGTTTATDTVTIDVTDVGLLVAASQVFSVSEAATNGTVLGSVATTGDAATGFSITAGNTGGAFAIDAVGQLTVADATVLDFETTLGYTLTVQASDGTSDDRQPLTMDVLDANEPPILANPLPDQAATTGQGFSFTAPAGTFSDPDAGDSLALAATLADGSPLPAWLGFTATIGIFTGTPGSVDLGTIQVRVTATDGGGHSVSDTFQVTVADTAFAPTLTALPDQATEEFQLVGPISFTVADADTPTTSLSISAVSANQTVLPDSGITLGGSGADRTLTLQPAPGQIGTVDVTVTVSDGTQATSSTFELTVNRVHPAPVLVDAWGEELASGDAVSCDCGGVLALRATDGSGSFQLDVVSAPPGAGPSSVVADGSEFTFLASAEGAFAGEYVLSLTDRETGRAVEVTYEVPLEIDADQSSLLDTDTGAIVAVLGGAPGDVYSCTVLDVTGQPDLAGDLAVVTASPAGDAPTAGNPATVAITPAGQPGVAVFRVRCENVFQPDLEPATTGLLRLVPSSIFAATVRDADGIPVADARVGTRKLRDHRGEPYRATTDTAGWFELALPTGSEAYAVFEVHAVGLAPALVMGTDLYLPDLSVPVADLRLRAPERTITGTITGLAGGEIAEVSGVYRDDDGTVRSTPAEQVTGDGSGTDGYTLYLGARRYERFTVSLDQRFAMAQDNQGSGYDLSGANTPSVTFALGSERRYRGVEISPPDMAAAVVVFEETGLATDLADHAVVAFDAEGVSLDPFSLTPAGNILEAAFAGDAALRMALLDERGMVVAAVTHDPAGGIDAGPGGTAQVLSGGGSRVRFTALPDGGPAEAGSYVEVELPPAGLDTSGLACDPPPATVEVRTRQAVSTVGWAPLLTSATGNRSTQVEIHQGDCDGGLAAVAAAGGEVTLPPLVITLPFDTQTVGPGDLESGRYRIYHAENLTAFQAGEVQEVPPEAIVAMDLLNGTVSFTVEQLSVFGVGPEGLAVEDAPAVGAGSGGGASGCFLASLRSVESGGWWQRLAAWVGSLHEH